MDSSLGSVFLHKYVAAYLVPTGRNFVMLPFQVGCLSCTSLLAHTFSTGVTVEGLSKVDTARIGRVARLASTMSTSCQYSSVSKCRHCTLLYSVPCSPSVPMNKQIALVASLEALLSIQERRLHLGKTPDERWRHYTFLYSVPCSPPLLMYIQVSRLKALPDLQERRPPHVATAR